MRPTSLGDCSETIALLARPHTGCLQQPLSGFGVRHGLEPNSNKSVTGAAVCHTLCHIRYSSPSVTSAAKPLNAPSTLRL